VITARAGFIIAALAFAGAVRAEPRFAARFGFPCAVCHVNPAGGGPRTAYARDVFEKQQLTFSPGSDGVLGLDFDPRISDRLTLGGDFRLAMIWQPNRRTDDPPPSQQTLFIPVPPTKFTFFPMQVDTYVVAELSRRVTLYTDVGVNGSFEAFALFHDLPFGTYLKAGYFIPPFGTKLPNHSSAMREPLGFPPFGKDAGVEFGITRPWLDAQVALQNGELGGTLDRSYKPALSGRVALIHDFGRVKATVGPSYRWVPSDVQVDDAQGVSRTLTSNEVQGGGFLWLAMGRLSYIGEIDWHIKDDATQLNAQNRATRSGQLVSYNEIMLLVDRGVDAGITWEFMDRDIYGARDSLHRLGIQGSIFPMPYTEIQAFVRFYKPVFEPTAAAPRRLEQDKWEIILFAHLFW
jgi:hypothetical protein